MYEEDRQTALAMYNRLFDEVDDEQGLLQLLVSPTRQAVVIARSYNAKERKLQVHAQSREESDTASDGAAPEFMGVIESIREEALSRQAPKTAEVSADQFSMFEDDFFAPTPEPPAGLQCYKVAIAQELLFLFLLPSGQEAALDAYLTRYAQILRREVPEAVCARSLVYACTESWRLYPECLLSRLLPVFSDGALPADYQALHRYAQQQPQETDGSAALLERLDHDSSQITPVLRSLFLSFARSGVFYDLHGSKLLCISFLDSFGRTGNPFSCSADEWESDFMLSFKKAILTSQNLESLYDVMLRILHRLFDRADGPAQPKSKLVADTLRYIQENYPSACLTEAANRAFVSPSYLSKLFASEMQVSFSRYLMCYRIGIAKKLLQGNGSKLYEIALSVGYSDVAHLSKAFKTIEGISPGQYKA